jgi:hypothetical protein
MHVAASAAEWGVASARAPPAELRAWERLGRLEIEKTLHYIVTFGVALNAITVHKSVSWSVTHHSGRRDAALPCIVRSRTNIAFRLMGCRRNMDVWNRRFLVNTLPLDAFPRRS